MYYNFDLQRKQQKKVFMNYRNFDTEELLHQTQSDVFIKQIKTFKIDLNLFRASVMILYESKYDQKLNDQISKRAYRFDQQRIVTFYIFRSDTVIEKLIKQKHKDKFDFKKKYSSRYRRRTRNIWSQKMMSRQILSKELQLWYRKLFKYLLRYASELV